MRKSLANVIASAIVHGADIKWAPHYSEPGYYADTDGIYFANWNPTSFPETRETATVCSRIGALLEREGVPCEWSDEWTTCDDCGGAVRYQSDSYWWTPSYVWMNECEIICADCLLNDLDVYESYLLNNPNRADTFRVDWEARGWVRADRCETGWHPGQNDDPQTVFDRLTDRGHDVLFTIDSTGQFDTHWSAWIRRYVNAPC